MFSFFIDFTADHEARHTDNMRVASRSFRNTTLIQWFLMDIYYLSEWRLKFFKLIIRINNVKNYLNNLYTIKSKSSVNFTQFLILIFEFIFNLKLFATSVNRNLCFTPQNWVAKYFILIQFVLKTQNLN